MDSGSDVHFFLEVKDGDEESNVLTENCLIILEISTLHSNPIKKSEKEKVTTVTTKIL